MLDPLHDPLKDKAVVPKRCVDALEKQGYIRVVRCKDCANGSNKGDHDGYVYCEIFGYGGYMREDWYCADGKLMDGGE